MFTPLQHTSVKCALNAMGARFAKFTQGFHDATSAGVATFCLVAFLNNNGRSYDLADDMREIYFRHRQWKNFADCFPKSGCADNNLCYAVNERNVCDYMKTVNCICMAGRNCTTDDWAAVKPVDCGIDTSSEQNIFLLIFLCIFCLYVFGAARVHVLLHRYCEMNITYCRYYAVVLILQACHIVSLRIFVGDIGNYDGLYWKGCSLMSVILLVQHFAVLIWPFVMDRTMPVDAPRVTSNARRGADVDLRRDIGNLRPAAVAIRHMDQRGAETERTTDTMDLNTIPAVHAMVQLSNNFVQMTEDNASPHVTEAGHTDESNNICLICLYNKRDILLLPCRHLCYCQGCGTHPANAVRHCPYCRKQVHSVMKIYVP